MTEKELHIRAKALGITLTDTMLEKLRLDARLLLSWNEKINLTAIKTEAAVYEKHFLDSLLLLSQWDIQGQLLDVGSGAGFPGVVLAVARPDLYVTLLEPTGKRCVFLTEVKKQLQLERVTIEQARAEDFVKEKREQYDCVTARAVAPLPILAELCIPLVKVGGLFLAMKGAQGEAEADRAGEAYRRLGCDEPLRKSAVLSESGMRVNLGARKVKKTPPLYPRPYGTIKKKPLEGIWRGS